MKLFFYVSFSYQLSYANEVVYFTVLEKYNTGTANLHKEINTKLITGLLSSLVWTNSPSQISQDKLYVFRYLILFKGIHAVLPSKKRFYWKIKPNSNLSYFYNANFFQYMLLAFLTRHTYDNNALSNNRKYALKLLSRKMHLNISDTPKKKLNID